MQSFLEEVVQEVYNKHQNLEDVVFVLPSKRAGTFLKNTIGKVVQKTIFLPETFAIETFVERISGIQQASNTQLLFQLYQSYLAITPDNPDSFYTFTKWGQTLLQDFNEIDRYLVDAKQIFSYLSAIKELDYWEATPLMKDYISFWNNLEPLYLHFTQTLLEQQLAHQGLLYKKACEVLPTYLEQQQQKTFIFIGFNALNKAEEQIIQHILQHHSSEIYWDLDPYFLNDPVHDAGLFIRQHKKQWPYFRENSLKGIKENFLKEKHINIIGVPKNVSQMKYIGNVLQDLTQDTLKNTAVVLGDESLLNPLLNSIPQEIEGVNITMGYPLHKSPLANLFDELLELYLQNNTKGWYYKRVLDVLAHPYIQLVLGEEANSLINEIKTKNWTFITSMMIEKRSATLQLLLNKNIVDPKSFNEACIALILEIQHKLTAQQNYLGLEYLYRFYQLFNQLQGVLQQYSFITDLRTHKGLYKELMSSETLDFKGEPLKGLQIMGMLESRNLDFETVIISSVNEGILPSGKSNNSFIPFDVKIEYGLPTYKEKDAVYTYHFYRLLQRAKNVYVLYNTEPDVLEGGEKSRLIHQLLADDAIKNNITEVIAAPTIVPITQELQEIVKNDNVIEGIKRTAEKGFSPTSLTNYIRNPIDFYKRSILRIDDILEVEENVAANTFGTIVHDSLEELYQPFIGAFLSKEKLQALRPDIIPTVKKHFAKTYAEGDITKGRNLIAYHVILKYVEQFIALEIKELEHHSIKILALEEFLSTTITVPNVPFPLKLHGKLDRIDEKDGVVRIIDYKTGKVEARDVKITEWDDLISTYDKSKAFQLLCYAVMFKDKYPIPQIEAGIFSFKNMNAGILPFKDGNTALITDETTNTFLSYLSRLIQEICDPNIPLIEKEV